MIEVDGETYLEESARMYDLPGPECLRREWGWGR